MQQFGQSILLELMFTIFGFVVLAALPVALIATLFLIWLFRFRLGRTMTKRAAVGSSIEPARTETAVVRGELEIDRIAQAPVRPAGSVFPLLAYMRREMRSAVWWYVAATGASSLVLALAMLLNTGFSPTGAVILKTALLYALLTLELSTPVVLAAAVVMTKRTLAMLLAVFLLLLALWTVDRFIAVDGVGTWALVAGWPTAAVLLLNTRRFRAIGPIVYVALIMLLFGATAGQVYGALQTMDAIGPLTFVREDLAPLPFVEALNQYFAELISKPLDQILADPLWSDPLSVIKPANPDGLSTAVRARFFSIAIASALAGAIVAWLFMRWLGSSYRERRASDQMLTIDVLMVTFTLPVVLPLTVTGEYLIPAGALGGLACYKALAIWGLRRSQHVASKRNPKTLLLLRVFGSDRRTQRLLDDLGLRWRYLGPIRLIAGPDAAYTTIEPHEFFEFMSRRLTRSFIKGTDDLERRLAESTATPDPDGLFRVQDFFCHEDTWQMTVARLAHDADAVLMDLRGFGRANRGIIYEIEHLMGAVNLERVTLLTDTSTDQAFLDSLLKETWRSMPAGSPNVGPGPHRLRVLQASPGHRRTVDAALNLLCGSLREQGQKHPY